MAIEVKLPDLGDGIESADVINVFVKEGDTVKAEQNIIEIETDKAAAEVPTKQAGNVSKVRVSKGDTIKVGAVILELEGVAQDDKGKKKSGGDKEQANAAAQEQKDNGDAEQAAQDEEGHAADEEAVAETDEDAQKDEGVDGPAKPPAQKPTPVTPAKREAATKSTPAEQPRRASAKRQPADDNEDDAIPAGPAVRRFAREVGVRLGGVTGSGPGGRITRDDVLAAVRAADRTDGGVAQAEAPQTDRGEATTTRLPAISTGSKVSTESVSDTDDYGSIRIEKLTRIRKTISAKMEESWTTIPRVTNFDDADVTELEAVRQRSKLDYAAAGIKLTTMPFLIKSVALALQQHPILNASLDLDNAQVIYHDYVNVGIAVDTVRGLVVPSLRGVNRMPIAEIARHLQDIGQRARDGDFAVADLRGSTFTVSNLGAIGGTYSTPIINPPEVAILLVGRTRKLPMYVDEQLQPRMMMPLSISYDHRLVDGAAAGRFLNEVKDLLQSPSRLLLAP